MANPSRVVLVVALVGLTAFAEACHHRPVVVTPEPPHLRRWILTPDADDDDQFCVPSPNEPGTATSDAFPLRCSTVGEIRGHVRRQRVAE